MKNGICPVILFVLLTAACAPEPQPEVQGPDGTVFRQMAVERLPELNAPRGGHQTLLLGDELTVIGGHTDGFKLVETAEYLSGGAWHEMQMNYPHDGGFVAPLPDGTVMAGGGSAEPFGIGQSWGVEVYDPRTHGSRPVGIMDRKRAYASALPLPDGRVIISGNMLAEDAVEIWDPAKGFSFAGEVSLPRERPWILPAGPEEVIIFGGRDRKGLPTEPVVDRLHGEPYREPLLETWAPDVDFFGADRGKIGEYAYLLYVRRRVDGEPGVLIVSGGEFSVLQIERPLPRLGIDGVEIVWAYGLQVDRTRREAWLQGNGADGRIYFARIGYDATFEGGDASVDLFYAAHPDGVPFAIDPVLLLPGGRQAKTGGKQPDPNSADLSVEQNFTVSRDAFIFHSEPLPRGAGVPWLAWLAGALVLGGLAAAALLRRKPAAPDPAPAAPEGGRSQLSEQIIKLIEEEQLYKRKGLRISDVATELATNKTYVSAMINNISGFNFPDLINGYRIRDAQALMQAHPEMPLADVAEECGFSSLTTLRRCFKAQTGKTPQEWRNSIKK